MAPLVSAFQTGAPAMVEGITSANDGIELMSGITPSDVETPQATGRGGGGSASPPYTSLMGKLDHSQPGKGFRRLRRAPGTWRVYYKDIFHTLLNMPAHRFLLVFFSIYILEFFVFALIYQAQADKCVIGEMGMRHAMWFSVQTASTTGLLHLCPMRLPFASAATQSCTWLVTQQLMVLLAIPCGPNLSELKFVNLKIADMTTQTTNLKLGLVASIKHIITPDSPLYGISLVDMEYKAIEVFPLYGISLGDMEYKAIEVLWVMDCERIGSSVSMVRSSIKHIITPDSPLYGMSLVDMEYKAIEVL
eukprot:gene15087-21141_t